VYHKWRHYKSKSEDPLKMHGKPRKKLRNFLKRGSGFDEVEDQRNRDLAAMRREANANNNGQGQNKQRSGSGMFDNAVFSVEDET